MEPHELREHWLRQALARAGIDRKNWHPARGVDENRRVVEDVYGYYGRLFLQYEFLEWAGMANMIGPAFYAGFRDIGYLPDGARRTVAAIRGRGSRGIGRDAAGDLGFYETTFLHMQKKIFEDQATMHEAYLAGGISQIEEFYRARIIDIATRNAWRQIDTGRRHNDTALIDCGNRALLFREQFDIIDRFYVRMLRHHGPVGPLVTYGLTLAGMPSVPRARSFPERYPFVARLPGTAARVRTPLPRGNIAMFADRWQLIEDDTLPRYLEYIHRHLNDARDVVTTPVSERMRRYRLRARAGRLAARGLTRWGLDIGGARAGPRGRYPAVAVDLPNPAEYESAGSAGAGISKVWMNNRRRPFDITVTLPGGYIYRTPTNLAAILHSTCANDLDRMVIQLPATDIDATQLLLLELSAEWGFPPDAVAAWRVAAENPEFGNRHYSTHVFTPSKVSFVHLEFQVSHHVRDREFVVTTLFSWHSQVA